MINKLTCASVAAITSIVLSSSALAHVANGALVSGNGQPVSSSYTKCIKVASGKFFSKCQPIEPKEVAAPKPEPKPAPAPVAKEPSKPEYESTSPKPALVKVTDTVSLAGDALFATNSSDITAAGTQALDKLVTDLAKVEPVAIDLTGHADSRGNDAYNQALSERRAKSVADYLVSKGVSSSIITSSGKGETQPVASNATKEGRAQNRRVDIKVTANKTIYK
jgi:outer membrane protein OmpA-like peptidoglycan-associated protein